jgi:cytochrome c oxidase assembly factor 2
MHYLHPRSRQTGTLFTATLAISFFVVALPHLLPCPVDRRQYADTIELPDGTIRRRRRTVVEASDGSGGEAEVMVAESLSDGSRPKRECPVPKPGGLVGQIMGFEKKERERDVEVVVGSLRPRGGGVRDGNGRAGKEREEAP